MAEEGRRIFTQATVESSWVARWLLHDCSAMDFGFLSHDLVHIQGQNRLHSRSVITFEHLPTKTRIVGHVTMAVGPASGQDINIDKLRSLNTDLELFWIEILCSDSFDEVQVIDDRDLVFFKQSFAERWKQFQSRAAEVFNLYSFNKIDDPHFSVDEVFAPPRILLC